MAERRRKLLARFDVRLDACLGLVRVVPLAGVRAVQWSAVLVTGAWGSAGLRVRWVGDVGGAGEARDFASPVVIASATTAGQIADDDLDGRGAIVIDSNGTASATANSLAVVEVYGEEDV